MFRIKNLLFNKKKLSVKTITFRKVDLSKFKEKIETFFNEIKKTTNMP